MEIPKDVIIPVLQGKVTAIFKTFNGKYELCGERNLSVSRKAYAIADILSNSTKKIDEITDKDLEHGGFVTQKDFEKWWFSKGHKKFETINVVHFEILRFRPRGISFLKRMRVKIPKIKGD